MQFFNHIAAIAILAGPLSLVLGAQTIEEITINIQDAQTAVTDANNDAKNVNTAVDGALKYNTIVNNNNNIAKLVGGYDSALEGTMTLTSDQQTQLLEAVTPFFNVLAAYYETVANKAQDFLVMSERKAVVDSVDALEQEIDTYSKDLEALGTAAKTAIQAKVSNDDQAREDVDDSYGSPVIG